MPVTFVYSLYVKIGTIVFATQNYLIACVPTLNEVVCDIAFDLCFLCCHFVDFGSVMSIIITPKKRHKII